MAQEIERDFSMGDDAMLERAQLFHDTLNGELADFTARFPWLDAAWLTALETDIASADQFPKDDSLLLDQKVLTGDVGTTMRRGYSALQDLGMYAKLAFPDDVARQRVFGQQLWNDAYDNTLKLQEALELAYNKADDAAYKTPLLDKGYTQAEIDELNTMARDLQFKNGLQESAKAGRAVSRHDRIMLHNIVWGHMRTINTCAQIVWREDADRLGQYQLYPSSSTAPNTTVGDQRDGQWKQPTGGCYGNAYQCCHRATDNRCNGNGIVCKQPTAREP